MKIAAFYENIYTGIQAAQRNEREVLTRLRDLGLQMIYINYESLAPRKEELLPLFSELGLEVEGLHCWFKLNENPKDEQVLRMVDLAVEAHAANILIVPGLIDTENQTIREKMMDNMVQGFQIAVDYAAEKGIDVTIEDCDALTAPYSCCAGMQYFLDKVPGLKCCFDTGNLALVKEDELEAFHQFQDKTCTLHLKDRSKIPLNPGDPAKICADGEKLYPCPIGSGFMKIGEIIQELKVNAFPGNVIIEMYDYTDMLPGIEQSIRWLKTHIEENTITRLQ